MPPGLEGVDCALDVPPLGGEAELEGARGVAVGREAVAAGLGLARLLLAAVREAAEEWEGLWEALGLGLALPSGVMERVMEALVEASEETEGEMD